MSSPDRAPIEVEVVQPPTNARPLRRVVGGPDIWLATLAPGSLDEARMRLADAVELRHIAWQEWDHTAKSNPAGDPDAYDRYMEAVLFEEERFAEVRRLREAGNV